jgi:hypothetical protein
MNHERAQQIVVNFAIRHHNFLQTTSQQSVGLKREVEW